MPFVFGYGSLAHRDSVSRALKRIPDAATWSVARLTGFARIWGAGESVACVARPGVVTRARFLDLAPRDGALTNGVLLRVSDVELEHLKIREKSYAMVDVTGRVDCAPPGANVFAFASAPGTHFDGGVVLGEYVRLVEEGFGSFGARFLDEFRASTETPPVPVLPGLYRFVDPEQNSRTSRADVDAA